ncbi:TetR/AcrR family transcriptional regulator [Modestobacter caceresii]|nr:TetR/AcrR family transcriptional regulator [Modestobacter caceresii]
MSSPGSRPPLPQHPSLPVPTVTGRGGVTVLEADAAESAAAEAAAAGGQHLTTPVPAGAAFLQPPAPGHHVTAPVPSLTVAVPAPRPTAPRQDTRRPGRAGVPMSRTRRGLLNGARTAFAERGVRKTTMQHVAAAAGVAKATLYNHFRTKDDVAHALIAFELDRLAALAAELPLTVAVPALAEEVGGHPVLRRLAETEPETLVQMMGLDADRWGDVVVTLGSALRISRPEAELVCRWLLGLVLQPGTVQERAAQAAVVTGQLVG